MALMRDYASDKQVSPPSIVYKQSSLPLNSLCMGVLFNCTDWGIHLCKTSQFYILKMRLGGDLKFTRLTDRLT